VVLAARERQEIEADRVVRAAKAVRRVVAAMMLGIRDAPDARAAILAALARG
jgi:hypothetical protein